MGRPRGAKGKLYRLPDGTLGPRRLAMATVAPVVVDASPSITARPDAEVLAEIKEQFDVFGILLDGVVAGKVRSLMSAGAPGVGKSHLVETKLERAKNAGTTQYRVVSGGISAVGLYKLGWEMRHPGHVIVLDDSDDILENDEGVSILKALTDSGQYRHVHWLKESAALVDDDGNPIDTSYEYNGAMVFVTNRNVQQDIDAARTKFAPHLKAISDRALYLDLLIHDRQQLGVWVNHIASSTGIFPEQGITEEHSKEIMAYINDHRTDLRDLSLRTIIKSCDLMKTAIDLSEYTRAPVNFARLANTTLLRKS